MKDQNSSLDGRRLLTIVFALLSGLSAVSSAVAPAILHI
jgi:hypothetical protein